jgi:hypothetical protein
MSNRWINEFRRNIVITSLVWGGDFGVAGSECDSFLEEEEEEEEEDEDAEEEIVTSGSMFKVGFGYRPT